MTPEELEFHKLGIKLKFVYSLVGLFVGLACIGAGTFLGINGVVGHTSWTASLFGLSTNINDAAPGVIVFVVGIFFVLITRLKINVKKQGNDTDVVYQRKVVIPERSTEADKPSEKQPEEPQRSEPPSRRDYTPSHTTPSHTRSYSSSISYTSDPKTILPKRFD